MEKTGTRGFASPCTLFRSLLSRSRCLCFAFFRHPSKLLAFRRSRHDTGTLSLWRPSRLQGPLFTGQPDRFCDESCGDLLRIAAGGDFAVESARRYADNEPHAITELVGRPA